MFRRTFVFVFCKTFLFCCRTFLFSCVRFSYIFLEEKSVGRRHCFAYIVLVTCTNGNWACTFNASNGRVLSNASTHMLVSKDLLLICIIMTTKSFIPRLFRSVSSMWLVDKCLLSRWDGFTITIKWLIESLQKHVSTDVWRSCWSSLPQTALERSTPSG